MTRENFYKGIAKISLAVNGISGLALIADTIYEASKKESSFRTVELAVGGVLTLTSVLWGSIKYNDKNPTYTGGSDADDALKEAQKIPEEY